MSIFKRGLLAVIRKPIKSVISLKIILCIALLTTIGISASHTSYQAQLSARNRIGAFFELMLDQDNYWERMNALLGQGYDLTWIPPPPASPVAMYAPPNFTFISLLLDDIRVLSEVDGILHYNVEALWHEMRAVNFNRVEGAFLRPADIPAVSLRGFTDLAFMGFVKDGSITLIEGRWTRADDIGKIVVSKELAELNKLTVGDVLIFETLPMRDISMLEVMKRHGFIEPPPMQISGEIVGIYQNNRNIAFSAMPGIVSRSAENSIFTDLHFVEVGVRTGDPFYYRAYFYVANVDEFDEVAARLLSADIDWSRYTIIERNDAIEELGSSFAQLKEVGNVMLAITLVSGFLILSLSFTFLIKGRSNEIGIWLSLGNHKKNIILQMLWENIMLTVVALAICFVTIPLVVDVAELFLNNHLVAYGHGAWIDAETTDFQEPGVYAANGRVNNENIQLTVNTDTFAIVAGVIFVLIITSTVLAITPVVILKPREIFSRLS